MGQICEENQQRARIWQLPVNLWCLFCRQTLWRVSWTNINHTLMIPASCTSKCQPMDVCINKPFKAILRKFWVEHVNKAVEKMPSPSPSYYKLPQPTRQDMVDWVEKVFQIIYFRWQGYDNEILWCMPNNYHRSFEFSKWRILFKMHGKSYDHPRQWQFARRSIYFVN